MTANVVTSSAELVLDGRDFLSEVACSETSWPTAEAQRQGLPAHRFNYQNGFDIYHKDTWVKMTALQQQRRPRKIWLSLPCAKWCQFANLNYNTPERREVLETARRKERRMLRNAKSFILDALTTGPDLDIYWEWTHPCSGWNQQPVLQLRDGLHRLGQDWLPCRVDGCRYGMTNKDCSQLLHKKWLIRTNDEKFHQLFKSKVCTGNHQHAKIEGAETARTAYYPLNMVTAIVRHWLRELVPLRHIKYVTACHDLHFNEFEDEDSNWVRRQLPPDNANPHRDGVPPALPLGREPNLASTAQALPQSDILAVNEAPHVPPAPAPLLPAPPHHQR